MPIFEYDCRSCGHAFEALVTARRTPQCPSCQGTELTKRLSVFAVGSRGDSYATSTAPGACGTCGDPRGPGSCSLE